MRKFFVFLVVAMALMGCALIDPEKPKLDKAGIIFRDAGSDIVLNAAKINFFADNFEPVEEIINGATKKGTFVTFEIVAPDGVIRDISMAFAVEIKPFTASIDVELFSPYGKTNAVLVPYENSGWWYWPGAGLRSLRPLDLYPINASGEILVFVEMENQDGSWSGLFIRAAKEKLTEILNTQK